MPAGQHPDRRGLVDTGVALRVAGRLAIDPMEGSYLLQDLASHFAELVAEAEPLVIQEAGFGPSTPARARVMSRSAWAQANVSSIVTLLAPLLEKVDARIPRAWPVGSPAGPMGRPSGRSSAACWASSPSGCSGSTRS